MRRRTFIAGLGSAVASPLVALAQPALPVVGFVHSGSADQVAAGLRTFRQGLGLTGHVEGRNVTIEAYWLDGQFDRAPTLIADLVRRRVAVIVALSNTVALASKAATAMIPIVFGVAEDPVKLGLVTSLGRPGGNATGVNFFAQEVNAKRLTLLHELLPKAVRIAVLVNPAEATNTQTTLRDVQEAARTIDVQIRILDASTIAEIDAAFAVLAGERPDALFVGASGFFASRGAQFVALAARDRIPAAHSQRSDVERGGLMSYGASFPDIYRQFGIYAGGILKGAKPADLPVVQPTRFEFVINLTTAKALGIEVSPQLLAITDEVIE